MFEDIAAIAPEEGLKIGLRDRIWDMYDEELLARLKGHLNRATAPGVSAENSQHDYQYAARYLYQLLCYATDRVIQVQYQKEAKASEGGGTAQKGSDDEDDDAT